MPSNADDKVIIPDHDFAQLEFAEPNALPEDVRSSK